MSKTLELYDKVQKYNGPQVMFVITGGGMGVVDLVKVMGASKLIHTIHIPYDANEAIHFVTQNIQLPLTGKAKEVDFKNVKHVSEEWATLLCEAGLVEQEETCRVIAITAALTTNRYRKGENQAWIADGTNADNIKTYHLALSKLSEQDHQKFFPGYVDWKRSSEDRQVTDFVFDLLFNTTPEEKIEEKYSSNKNFENSYKSLIEDQNEAFLCKMDGTIISLKEYFSSTGLFDIIPGSFNPIHDTHREIFENIPKARLEKTKVCFEISVERIGKEFLTLEEMQSRVAQFQNYADVLITRAPRFIEKIGLLSSYTKNIHFHVGIDTISRMKTDYTSVGIQALNAKFAVYYRFIDGKVRGLSDEFKKIPNNCMTAPINRSLESMKRSSTEIRNNRPSSIPSALAHTAHTYSISDVKGLF